MNSITTKVLTAAAVTIAAIGFAAPAFAAAAAGSDSGTGTGTGTGTVAAVGSGTANPWCTVNESLRGTSHSPPATLTRDVRVMPDIGGLVEYPPLVSNRATVVARGSSADCMCGQASGHTPPQSTPAS